MEISATTNAAINQAQDAVGIYALKKALQLEAQSAAQLIQALPQPAQPAPAAGGSNIIDVYA